MTGAFRIFRIVFAKELSELRRDRKTLFWLFAPPIIFPLIALVAAGFIGTQTARYITEGFSVAVVNAQAAPGLIAKLEASGALIVAELADGEALPADTLITLTLPGDFQAKIGAGQAVRIKLAQRDNSFAATLALGAVRSEIDAYNSILRAERLRQLGVSETYLNPLSLDESVAGAGAAQAAQPSGVAAPLEAAASGSNPGLGALFLPLAVTSWLIGGGLGLIVDTTVGEKERQTIETILVTPASRIGIVAGKLSVVFLASLVVMGLWMVEGMVLSIFAEVGPRIAVGGNAALLIGQSLANLGGLVFVLLILLLPFVVFLNSVVMIFCSFARSYRESNTFLFLVQLILPALVLLSVFSIGPDAGAGWYATPLLGTIIAIRDLFSRSLSGGGLALAALSAAVYAICATLAASYTFSRVYT